MRTVQYNHIVAASRIKIPKFGPNWVTSPRCRVHLASIPTVVVISSLSLMLLDRKPEVTAAITYHVSLELQRSRGTVHVRQREIIAEGPTMLYFKSCCPKSFPLEPAG